MKEFYPLGVQTFEVIRENGYTYVDKTDLIYRLTHDMSRNVFLSRPRRFGKSLLVSTLKAYFEGRKELFTGLAVEKLEKDWTEHPVLRFDMSGRHYEDVSALSEQLSLRLSEYEEEYSIERKAESPGSRLECLVKTLYQRTGKKVVVLIDEYDAPLLDVIHDEVNLPPMRRYLRSFYSPLKPLDPYLRFVFLTGITKFSQLSIFSELNNIKNISLLPEYSAICGFTEQEMLDNFSEGIAQMANTLEVSYDQAVDELKRNYDGYHFTMSSPDIYNPFSLLNALADRDISSYWFNSATPSFIIEMLRKYKVLPQDIGNRKARSEEFDAPTERLTNIVPLLYQSGYLTIKSYDRKKKEYLLDIPNNEVRLGLMRSLLPYYVSDELYTKGHGVAANIAINIEEGNIAEALKLLQKFLRTIPYTDNSNSEGHYQSLLYVILTLAGNYSVDVEVRTVDGRVDMVVKTDRRLYLVELKIDKTAAEAVEQINLKHYDERFAFCQLPIVKVGVNFDIEQRTISDWEIEGEE